MTEPLNVRDFGAVGDGVTDDTAAMQETLDAAYGAGGHGIDYHFSRVVIIPAGTYRTTAPLTICNTWGAHVIGAGMSSTIIRNEGETGGTVLSLNGVGYSTFEHLRLEAEAGGIACEYNWDGTGAVGGQLVSFYKMCFGSIGGHTVAGHGCRVGYAGNQCDTSSWIDCAFGADVGVGFYNLNSISHRVVGGNFQGCRIGIYVPAGAVQEIAGVGFQESSEWDIKIEGGAGDATLISGISTESANFVHCGTNDCGVTIIGCSQRSHPGVFANGAGVLNIEGCLSKGGTVGSGRIVTIRNSQFWRMDALESFLYRASSLVKLENTVFGLDVGSIARREIDTIITSAGKRTRGIEGASLTAESVVSAGVANGNDDGGNIYFFPIEISIASPAVVGSATRWINSGANRHGFFAGTVIAFTTTGALPTGVMTDTAYYVLADGLTDTTFRIADSPGGTAINTSGSQSGVHSLYLVRMFAVGDQVLNSNVVAGGSPGWICTTAGPAIGGAVFNAMANVAH